MRAIGVTDYNGPQSLREVDLPQEPLGAGQVRIRVKAAAVNPTDTYIPYGRRGSSSLPGEHAPDIADVPGMDAAGELMEVGPDTDTDLVPGDRVMAIVVPSGSHGAYREDVVLPAASVTRAPPGLATRRRPPCQ